MSGQAKNRTNNKRKIIEDKRAPNPRRVRIFLAEKGIDVPTEQLDIMEEEHKAPDMAAMNLAQRIPILVLDDGDVVCESIAICRYFEALHPEPALMGTSPLEIAHIEMWQRRLEFLLLMPIANVLRHTVLLDMVNDHAVAESVS